MFLWLDPVGVKEMAFIKKINLSQLRSSFKETSNDIKSAINEMVT